MKEQTAMNSTGSTSTVSIPALLAQRPTAATLIADIQNGDLRVRTTAVQEAVLVGSSLIVPLGRVMAGSDPGAARAAMEALRRVAHHCARPRASAERRTAATELLKLISASFPRPVRAEALYLLGCVGGPQQVQAIAALLRDPALADDARMALQRIPGGAAARALRQSP
ncbi:MAG: hypothetical protein GX446_00285 [Chthonomonadales bacterium]|nr:hypothetical protein [Chthonomonadales bacterium]